MNTWKRLVAELAEKEPVSFAAPDGWTEGLFVARWNECAGHCVTCGAGLREWQASGHNLDRIDNKTPHIPANCQLVCWPCNRKKGADSAEAFRRYVNGLVADYGFGRVPWGIISDGKFQRAVRPDMTAWRIEKQLGLFPLART